VLGGVTGGVVYSVSYVVGGMGVCACWWRKRIKPEEGKAPKEKDGTRLLATGLKQTGETTDENSVVGSLLDPGKGRRNSLLSNKKTESYAYPLKSMQRIK